MMILDLTLVLNGAVSGKLPWAEYSVLPFSSHPVDTPKKQTHVDDINGKFCCINKNMALTDLSLRDHE